jgi:hypothetical protein
MGPIPGYEYKTNGQQGFNSYTCTKNLTLAAANTTTIKKWDVVMTPKYISASLLNVLRRFGLPIPRYLDFMRRVWTTTRTKTTISSGTVERSVPGERDTEYQRREKQTFEGLSTPSRFE